MIEYNPKAWFTFIFQFHRSDTFRRLFPMLLFYALASLELIAEEIENPFGTDPNDLPLESICETIRKSVVEILGEGR